MLRFKELLKVVSGNVGTELAGSTWLLSGKIGKELRFLIVFTAEEIDYILRLLNDNKQIINDPYSYIINKHCRLVLETIKDDSKVYVVVF